MAPLVSVVIVSFNTRDLLRQCLASIEGPAQPHISFETIVVDNASTDCSPEMVEREFGQVRLIRAGQNLGFARATNLGLSQSHGDLLLLLNPDTQVLDSAISRLATFLEQRPRVAAVGPALLYGDGRHQDSAFAFPTLWMSFLDLFPLHHRLLNSRLNGRYSTAGQGKPYPVDHLLGAAMMIRREALNDVGLLDESFFMYCEEVDWSIRARKLGWEIFCLPSATVIHHSGQSTRQFRDRMLIELNRSRFQLFRKHYSRRFLDVHRMILRAWLVREMLRAYWKARWGRIAEDEAALRLRTYRTLWEM